MIYLFVSISILLFINIKHASLFHIPIIVIPTIVQKIKINKCLKIILFVSYNC